MENIGHPLLTTDITHAFIIKHVILQRNSDKQ